MTAAPCAASHPSPPTGAWVNIVTDQRALATSELLAPHWLDNQSQLSIEASRPITASDAAARSEERAGCYCMLFIPSTMD